MKKIGILFGAENSFPSALVAAINARDHDDVRAEFITQGAARLDRPPEWRVIIDRISHQVPFYRAFLKHAVLHGAAVINNPFWWSADDKFLNYALAERLGIAVPRTALLPQKQPGDPRMLRNLQYPLDWQSIFDYTGFPAWLKPIDGGGWRNVHRIASRDGFFPIYDLTGSLCMVLQQEIPWTSYFRCLVIGPHVRIAPYNPHSPHHERFLAGFHPPSPALAQRIERDARRLSAALGYQCNTVEFAVHDGIPYAIDFLNPAPDFDLHSLGREHFDWAVETFAGYAIALAEAPRLSAAKKSAQLLRVQAPAKPPRTVKKSTRKSKAKAAKSPASRRKSDKTPATTSQPASSAESHNSAASVPPTQSTGNLKRSPHLEHPLPMATTSSPSHAQVELRKLGNSDLQLTPIGFGAWAIGGGNWQFGWGSQDDNDSIRAIQRALDLGINWIDTAAVYGLGRSEEVVAQALKQSGKRPYIFTKCSMRWDANREIHRSLKAASIREELENSLRRLRVDVIDLYQIHWPIPEEEIEEGWETLAKLKQEGKVRYIGVSNFNVEQMKRVQKIAPITSLQPPYSMINSAVQDEILPFCLDQNIGVINYSPMVSGLLTGKMTAERIQNMPADDWRRNNRNFVEPRLTRNLQLAELLREIGKPHGVEPGVVAVAWTLRNPAVTAAIVGARRPDQVDGIIPAMTFRLSDEEKARIDNYIQANP